MVHTLTIIFIFENCGQVVLNNRGPREFSVIKCKNYSCFPNRGHASEMAIGHAYHFVFVHVTNILFVQRDKISTLFHRYTTIFIVSELKVAPCMFQVLQ